MQMATAIESDTGEMIVKRVSVPIGLEELMEGLTKEVALKKPKDIYVFASEYFANLLNLREKGSIKGIPARRAKSVVKQISRENVGKKLTRKSNSVDPVKYLPRQMSIKSDSPPRKSLSTNKITLASKEDRSGKNTDKTKVFLDKRKARKESIDKELPITNQNSREYQVKGARKSRTPRERSTSNSSQSKSESSNRTPRQKSVTKNKETVKLPKEAAIAKEDAETVPDLATSAGITGCALSTSGATDICEHSNQVLLQENNKQQYTESIDEVDKQNTSSLENTISSNSISTSQTFDSEHKVTQEEENVAENKENIDTNEKSNNNIKKSINTNIFEENSKNLIEGEQSRNIIIKSLSEQERVDNKKNTKVRRVKSEEKIQNEKCDFDISKLHQELKEVDDMGKVSNFKTSYNPYKLRQETKEAFEIAKASKMSDVASEVAAAIKIQTSWKNYCARKSTKKEADITANLKNVDEIAKSVLKIQALWRGFKVREVLKQKKLFGTPVQAEEKSEETLDLGKYAVKVKAISKFQALWRGFKIRKGIKEMNDKLQELQKPAECDEMPHQRRPSDEDINKAALRIQAGVRGYMVRKKRNVTSLNSIAEEKSPDQHTIEASEQLDEVSRDSANSLRKPIIESENEVSKYNKPLNAQTDDEKTENTEFIASELDSSCSNKHTDKLANNAASISNSDADINKDPGKSHEDLSYEEAPTRPVTSDVVQQQINSIEPGVKKQEISNENKTLGLNDPNAGKSDERPTQSRVESANSCEPIVTDIYNDTISRANDSSKLKKNLEVKQNITPHITSSDAKTTETLNATPEVANNNENKSIIANTSEIIDIKSVEETALNHNETYPSIDDKENNNINRTLPQSGLINSNKSIETTVGESNNDNSKSEIEDKFEINNINDKSEIKPNETDSAINIDNGNQNSKLTEEIEENLKYALKEHETELEKNIQKTNATIENITDNVLSTNTDNFNNVKNSNSESSNFALKQSNGDSKDVDQEVTNDNSINSSSLKTNEDHEKSAATNLDLNDAVDSSIKISSDLKAEEAITDISANRNPNLQKNTLSEKDHEKNDKVSDDVLDNTLDNLESEKQTMNAKDTNDNSEETDNIISSEIVDAKHEKAKSTFFNKNNKETEETTTELNKMFPVESRETISQVEIADNQVIAEENIKSQYGDQKPENNLKNEKVLNITNEKLSTSVEKNVKESLLLEPEATNISNVKNSNSLEEDKNKIKNNGQIDDTDKLNNSVESDNKSALNNIITSKNHIKEDAQNIDKPFEAVVDTDKQLNIVSDDNNKQLHSEVATNNKTIDEVKNIAANLNVVDTIKDAEDTISESVNIFKKSNNSEDRKLDTNEQMLDKHLSITDHLNNEQHHDVIKDSKKEVNGLNSTIDNTANQSKSIETSKDFAIEPKIESVETSVESDTQLHKIADVNRGQQNNVEQETSPLNNSETKSLLIISNPSNNTDNFVDSVEENKVSVLESLESINKADRLETKQNVIYNPSEAESISDISQPEEEISNERLPDKNKENTVDDKIHTEHKTPTDPAEVKTEDSTVKLIHSGEFHDTIALPLSASPQQILSPVEKNASKTASSPGLQSTGELHDNVLPNQTAEASPAGAEILTSFKSKSINDGRKDGAQASNKDASKCGAQSDNKTPSTDSMESEKRNNASLPKRNMEIEAATKIQAGFRGYQVRKQLKNKISAPGDISNLRRSARRKSSGRITESGRTSQGKATDIEEKSAVKIQAGIRGFLVRRRQKKQKQGKELS